MGQSLTLPPKIFSRLVLFDNGFGRFGYMFQRAAVYYLFEMCQIPLLNPPYYLLSTEVLIKPSYHVFPQIIRLTKTFHDFSIRVHYFRSRYSSQIRPNKQQFFSSFRRSRKFLQPSFVSYRPRGKSVSYETKGPNRRQVLTWIQYTLRLG